MFEKVKNGLVSWFVGAISNGGAVFALIALVIAGAIGEGVQPADKLVNLVGHSPVASSPATTIEGWNCPDGTWARRDDNVGQYVSPFTVCTKNDVVIRHFKVPPIDSTKQTQAQDQGVYPFNDLDSVDDAIRIANAR